MKKLILGLIALLPAGPAAAHMNTGADDTPAGILLHGHAHDVLTGAQLPEIFILWVLAGLAVLLPVVKFVSQRRRRQ